VTAGDARGGVRNKVRVPADGGVSRGSLSGSPPPPRPEPKRKKGGPPPFAAAANSLRGMRTPGSSIPAKDPRVGGRDVTADIISAVSLLAQCAAGVLALGYPAAPVAAPPPSVTSPNVPGSTDGGLAGCDDKGEGGAGVDSPRVSRRSPTVGGRPVGSRVEPLRPPRSSPPLKGGKPPVNCWGCGVAGHLLRRCPFFTKIRGWCGKGGERSPATRGGEPSPGAPGNVTGPPGRVALGLPVRRPTPPQREADPDKATDLAAHCGPPARGHIEVQRRGRQATSPMVGTAAATSAAAAKGARSRGAGAAVSRPAPEVIAPGKGI